MSRLPIGIQTFRRIREEGFYYVDKTAYARRLVDDAGPHYFLSRPRRFGKSLFVDMLKELFEGNRKLFRGLAIHDDWDWTKRHPVVRLDFSGGNFKRPGELHANAMRQLEAAGQRAAPGPLARLVDALRGRSRTLLQDDTLSGRFATLLETLHRVSGRRVIVLVDEYDKPILDAIDEPEIATANRDDLRGLYGTIKGCDAHVELTFITGVSKFSKVSLFSDLNNLTDLTLDPAYAAICGYTEADLDAVFTPELAGLDRDEIRAWYNGYQWLGEEQDKVYNPFCLLKLFRTRRFQAHWFETATPRFLIDTLLRRGFAAPDLESIHASETLLSAFDVDFIAPEALLFQTGYLTITEVEEQPDDYPRYRLGYPNREVRRGLNEHLLDALAPNWREAGNGAALRRVLAAADWAAVEALLRKLMAGIPHDWHRRKRHRPLRRVLVERVLRLVPGVDGRRGRRGRHQPRAPGPSGTPRRERVPVRVQGRGAVGAGRRAGPVAGAPLRRQAPRGRPRRPSDRRGDQRRDTHHRDLRDGTRLSAQLLRRLRLVRQSVANQQDAL